MKKGLLFALLSVMTLNGWAAVSNVYWITWNVLPTVSDFNTAENWAYADWTTAYLPGTNDVANFMFWNGAALWTTRDWRIHFTESITNNGVIARAPLYGHQATFDLDQKTWSLLYDYNLNSGRGGRVVLTNGVLNVGRSLLLYATTDLPDLQTNAVWVAEDMEINLNNPVVSSVVNIDGVHAVLNGGRITAVTNVIVGASSHSPTNAALVLDKGVRGEFDASLSIGNGIGTMAEFVNVNGDVTVAGQLAVGPVGTGVVSLCNGTYTNSSPTMWHYIGTGDAAYGRLEVSGGTNLLVAGSAGALLAGRTGHAAISGSGGLTVLMGPLYMAYFPGSECEMTVTGGRWEMTTMQLGRQGRGSFTCSGGEVNMTSSLAVGTFTNGIGSVTITGGTVKSAADVSMGYKPGAVTDLTLSGDGLLRCRRIYKYFDDVTVHAGMLLDGGTLQASTAGTVIDVLDEVCLTTNGLVLDSDGKNVSIRSGLQNEAGQAGSLTKKGAGTLTLAAARTATGPVSVLAGTLVASNTLAVAEGLSTVNGTLTLSAGSLSVAAGAALAGTGTVSSVELAENAVICRAKTDGAATPLQADRFSSAGPLTIALTGYTVDDLKTMLPLIRTPSPINVSQVTVTLDGETLPGVSAIIKADQSQILLGVKYRNGTLISIH